MFLLNSLNGPFDTDTCEGLGANVARRVVDFIEKGKKTAEKNLKSFLKGEISAEQMSDNESFKALSQSYIPYSSVDEETETINLRQGMAFASVYIDAFDKNKDGAMSVAEAGPVGNLIDSIDNSGKITPGKYLSWLIFQDCSIVLNGVLSPEEIQKALYVVNRNPAFAAEKLREIYRGYKIDELEKDFELPLPKTGSVS